MTPENLKLYNVRVKPSIWEDARKIAELRGDRISDVIRDFLKGYVRRHRSLLTDTAERESE
jgi:hypothetical protein